MTNLLELIQLLTAFFNLSAGLHQLLNMTHWDMTFKERLFGLMLLSISFTLFFLSIRSIVS